MLVWSIVFAVLLVFSFAATMTATQNPFIRNTINSVMGDSERYLKSGNPENYQYYTSDYADKNEALAAANALNERIVEEGIILLENKDNALPLITEKRITVFGKNSVDLVLGGSGSNAGSNSAADVDICDSLENSGFICNPEIEKFYKDSSRSGKGRPEVPAMGDIVTGFPIAETPVSRYDKAVTDSFAEYSDAAIVILSRIGGEGYDLPRTMFWNGSSYTDWKGTNLIPGVSDRNAHYLELDDNEKNMLEMACANFPKVVVVFNSASPMELGFLKSGEYANVKAALWLGAPGVSGINALGRVLNGSVNPSGRTVDTFVKDFTLDPTWQNFGNGLIDGSNSYIMNGKAVNAYFVEYREGIYTGYRWYETKGYEAGGDVYDENVVYPFGYGKSYTDFKHTVTPSLSDGSALTADGKLTFDVNVENIGMSYDGKETVQLYYSAPYTDGIEKAHVVLGDFGKTEKLAKNGGDCNITLSIDVRDMASYDYNNANDNEFIGWEVEEGTYSIYITDNAHGWADDDAVKFTYTVPDGGFKYANDDVMTEEKIINRFDDVSNGIAKENYLSRKDGFANFDRLTGAFGTDNRTKGNEFIASLTYKLDDKETDKWYKTEAPTQSKRELSRNETSVKLYDLIGKKYGDALWEQLLDQLTVGQMTNLISQGNFHTIALENIDKPLTTDADGPMGYALFMGSDSVYGTCYYASECVLGATFNKDLAYEMGLMVGNEGIIGNEKGDGRPYSGWYAPAMNIHRSPFGGRNFEYYSEDGLLSGIMAENVAKGANKKGVYTFAKHFALNEQETNRDTTGLVTWANEQSMRELYFKPFEMTVKEGGVTAIMTSFNRIGITWAGGSYALLTELLRNEWGFEGTVITDFNLKTYMNTDQMLRAGGDLNLSSSKAPTSTTTATDIAAIRRATKNILFTVANSCAMNGFGEGVIWGYTTPRWIIWLIVINIVLLIVTAILSALTVIKKKKSQTTTEEV